MVRCRKVLGLVVAVSLVVLLLPQASAFSVTYQGPWVRPSAFEPSDADPERFGIDFVSSVDILANSASSLPQRYARAQQAAANWNRWPLYWPDVEASDNSFSYSYLDSLVNSDLAQGIRIDAVLMNTPNWAATGPLAQYGPQTVQAPSPRLGQKPPPWFQPLGSNEATGASPATYPPRNLYSPVFGDGTDVPGPGKSINASNYWARFVYNTVDHFRGRISRWEMWNEPDFKPTSSNGWFGFWSGSVQDYARMLKVGYLAAKQADSSVTVIMGGMAYWANTAFFGQLLDNIKRDASAASSNYFFDVTAWHWYSRSSQLFDQVASTRNTMATRGMSGKPVWVNETGIPAWNDPVHPPFGGANTRYPGSGTMDEQASYVIQALAYGLAASVDRTFVFQEHDDGNGEAFGLFRNNGTPRPAYASLQVASQYFESHTGVTKATLGNVERIVFTGTTKGTVTVLWNKSGSDVTYTAPHAVGTRAYLVDKAGTVTNLNPFSSSYSILLPRATNNNNHSGDPNDFIVGGSPYLLVEEPGNLRGHIRDVRDNVVIGAVASSGANNSSVDAIGQYLLAVPAGSNALRAVRSGFGTLPAAYLTVPSSGVTYYDFNLPPSDNAVQNGDFESGLTYWTLGGVVAPVVTSNAHTGSGALALGLNFAGGGDAGGGGNSTVQQWVTVPVGTQPTLSLTYWLQTSDVVANDRFDVIIAREDGQATNLLQNLQATSGYAHRWFDLSAWAGTRVRLTLNVWQSSPANPSFVYVDEVSVGLAPRAPSRLHFPMFNTHLGD